MHNIDLSKYNIRTDLIIENNDLDINEVSFIIGKIAHYIADCFCKYHLEEYYGKDMKNHFAYEFTLHLMLRKTL